MELVVKLPLFEDMPYFYKFKGVVAGDKQQSSVDMKVCFIYPCFLTLFN